MLGKEFRSTLAAQSLIRRNARSKSRIDRYVAIGLHYTNSKSASRSDSVITCKVGTKEP